MRRLFSRPRSPRLGDPARCRRHPRAHVHAFLDKGYGEEDVFPHIVYRVPTPDAAGPPGGRPRRWQIALCTDDPEGPEPALTRGDGEVLAPGRVAGARLELDGGELVCTGIDDPSGRSRSMLVHALVSFAIDHRARTVRLPPCEPLPRPFVGRGDAAPTLSVAVAHRLHIRPVRSQRRPVRRRQIAICHDTERGVGHLDIDPEFARRIDGPSRSALDEMLEIELRLGVRSTYSVLGCLWQDLPAFRAAGHSLAFHSFDHRQDTPQLARCRALDSTVRGYRPPRSIITPELAELPRYGFQWLACGHRKLAQRVPFLSDQLVKIPILTDDFDLHRGTSYDGWLSRLRSAIDSTPHAAIGLHDCYAEHWLPHYEDLLTELSQLGELTTMDQISSAVLLASAR